MAVRPLFAVVGLLTLSLAGCSRDGDIDSTGGISVTRSACPALAVPTHTGDVTLFNPVDSRDSRAIDVVANITHLRATCDESGANVVSNATFDVYARRNDPRGARDIVLPYFATVVRAGRIVVSKSVSSVGIHFNDGELRASTRGAASASINRAAATLPEDVRDKVTRRRRAGDTDAATDPLSDPAVREAVQRASFELLVGFQLSQDQLQYNATR